jgi:phosphohistidine phosphatase SixA
VTEKLRTQQTAEPLATSRGITPTQKNKADLDDLLIDVQSAKNRGGVIVIVGHNDTVPDIVAGLGGGTVTVGEQFDNLFVLTLRRWSTTRIIQATYGAPR